MRKILILIPSFRIGGTTSSLISFLTLVDRRKLQVDVFSLTHHGDTWERFKNCNILNENIWLSINIIHAGSGRKILNFFFQSIRRLLKLLKIDVYPLYVKLAGKQISFKDYDSVISFQENLSPILSYIQAKKRIAWIRCEYERYYQACRKNELEIYKSIDIVVCVSQFARDSFLKYYPELSPKTIVINNFLDEEYIITQSKKELGREFFPESGGLRLLSVGRMDSVKQFERIPEIAVRVLKERPDSNFTWLIVGDGDTGIVKEIHRRINLFKVQNYVIQIPAQNNVFPIMARADLFVHTSKSETFSRVVNEAKSLNVPVLVNNYGCASEFVENGCDGWIVPIDGMWEKICELIWHPEKLAVVKKQLQQKHYDNELIMNQIISLL